MKRNRLRLFPLFISILMALAIAFIPNTTVHAGGPTDEILNYTITAEVNDDATVNFLYDISWKVLDSDSLGPLEWVEIGVPNSHVIMTQAMSDSIDHISNGNFSNGNYTVQVYLKDKYYEGEVANFQFMVVMDYMYSMNEKIDGYTLFSFTPGWFDGIDVDKLNIRWKADNAESWSSGALVDGGYITWQTSLGSNEKYTVEISYPNEAYAFMETKSYVDADSDYSYEDDETIGDFLAGLLSLVFIGGFFVAPIYLIKRAFSSVFDNGRGFNTTQKKVTRTKIEYYPSCPGCGAGREEGKETCPYCGKNMVKNKTVIEESAVADADREALNYKTNGEYRYSSNPNTYVRVNVINIPVVRPTTTRSSSSSRSSCAHSSCAHSSCACACACACAGGGRAGCTTKDFYNTNLKLAFLKKRNRG